MSCGRAWPTGKVVVGIRKGKIRDGFSEINVCQAASWLITSGYCLQIIHLVRPQYRLHYAQTRVMHQPLSFEEADRSSQNRIINWVTLQLFTYSLSNHPLYFLLFHLIPPFVTAKLLFNFHFQSGSPSKKRGVKEICCQRLVSVWGTSTAIVARSADRRCLSLSEQHG